ncbi:MAG TPA: DinB family protein [Acidobacteriota bacterium]|nr:DinB family protein [Acidobacteriota bacterium]
MSMLTTSPKLSREEQEQTLALLNETRQDYLEALNQVSDQDWNRAPREGAWTPAQLAQHVVLAERRVIDLLTATFDKPSDAEWEETLGKEGMVIRLIPMRRRKAEAPEPVRPQETGLSRQEAVRQFEEIRGRTLALAKDTERPLKQYTRTHPLPAIGKLNGHQWLLFAAQHLRRHILQLQETLTTFRNPAA